MTGNKKLDTILLGVLTLVTLGSLGVFIYTEVVYQRPLPTNEEGMVGLEEDTKKAVYNDDFKLDPLVINLPSRTNRLRFLDIEVHLVPFKSEKKEFLEQHKVQIQDAIIDIASQMEPDELNSVSGKILLKNRIKKFVDGLSPKPVIKDVQLPKFIVQ